MAKCVFETKNGLGTIFQAEVDAIVWKIGTSNLGADVTAFIPASDNVNATHLALLSMGREGYWPEIGQLILMDNGSCRPFNLELMLRFCRIRGEGIIIRTDQNVDHKGAFDLLGTLDLVGKKYLLSLDSDIEFIRSGMIKVLSDELISSEAYCTGLILPERRFTAKGLHAEWPMREWQVNESILSSCCMWQTVIWKELLKEVGAGAYWLPEQGKFYDGMSRMHERATEKCYKRTAFRFDDYVKHYGSITWARRKSSPVFEAMNQRYAEITERLRVLGVSEADLQEDSWSGGGWAGLNVVEEIALAPTDYNV